ncbi:hypothetical protein Pan153_22270 [Gimesia panareensis]|uniref:Uncharacterized protein n=1 Tax=Gimesia panareensis TaxID=2527978 RepID=A0A518FMK0_9PLAN|nr:hypothetical protein [Gimesia panareensis]QDV17574.1 hypothetical protein Pan153_22270 [Gimesia panareensis]
MNQEAENLKGLVREFLDACGDRYFGFDGLVPRPLTEWETKLLSALQTSELSDCEKICVLSEGLDWHRCYDLVAFGMRLAIQAVRKNSAEYFRISLLPFSAGLVELDWRDQRVMPGVFERCGKRLGLNFQQELAAVTADLSDSELKQAVEDCVSREFSSAGYMEYGEGEEYLIL